MNAGSAAFDELDTADRRARHRRPAPARVLAIDQLADDAADRPTVARAVTVEVDTIGAQKIALAASLGNLSLMLRRAGEQHMDATRRVTTSDLTQTEVIQRANDAKRFIKVSVTRGANKQDYNVASKRRLGKPTHRRPSAAKSGHRLTTRIRG